LAKAQPSRRFLLLLLSGALAGGFRCSFLRRFLGGALLGLLFERALFGGLIGLRRNG
jgi:hypothetical protein